MIVALCLYKYFPYGGLQRDFMRIAKTIAARGHHVRVYTRARQGSARRNLSALMSRLPHIPTMEEINSIRRGFSSI